MLPIFKNPTGYMQGRPATLIDFVHVTVLRYEIARDLGRAARRGPMQWRPTILGTHERDVLNHRDQTRLIGSRHRQHPQVSGSPLSRFEQGLVGLENGKSDISI